MSFLAGMVLHFRTFGTTTTIVYNWCGTKRMYMLGGGGGGGWVIWWHRCRFSLCVFRTKFAIQPYTVFEECSGSGVVSQVQSPDLTEHCNRIVNIYIYIYTGKDMKMRHLSERVPKWQNDKMVFALNQYTIRRCWMTSVNGRQRSLLNVWLLSWNESKIHHNY